MTTKALLEAEHGVCRNCINKKYALNLTPRDCHYTKYAAECANCYQVHQMPCGFTNTGKIKILFAHEKRKPGARK